METLIIIAIWLAIFFVVRRFGCGAHALKQGASRQVEGEVAPGNDTIPVARGRAPTRAVDPVCGKQVSMDRAKPSVHAGEIKYFCSRDCREIFEAAPDLYLDHGAGRGAGKVKAELETEHV